MQLVVKPTAGGDKFTVQDLQVSQTVADLKAEVAKKSSVPAEQQRLIYKGQVLKDERTLDSYGAPGFSTGVWCRHACHVC